MLPSIVPHRESDSGAALGVPEQHLRAEPEYDITRLPILVRPHPDELFESWIQRLAETYAMTAWRLVKSLGFLSPVVIGEHLFVRSNGESALRRIGLSRHEVPGRGHLAVAMRYLMTAPDGERARRRALLGARYCPPCLEGTGYWKDVWSDPLTLVCPEHGTYLVTACPSCGCVPFFTAGWQSARGASVRCPTKLDPHGDPTTAFRGFTRCGTQLDQVAAPRASGEDLAAHTALVEVAVAALREAENPTTEQRAARAQATARDVAAAITAVMRHDPPYPIRPETDILLRDAVRSATRSLGTDDNGRGHRQADLSHGAAQALPAQRGIPAVIRTDEQGAARLLGVVYWLGAQHRNKDVTVAEIGDTLLFADLNGTLLMEHTRPALGVASVGARRGRNPDNDATRVPKVFRLTSNGAVSLSGVRYHIGRRHRGQEVRVVETTDGTILFTDLDGNTLIEYPRPARGVKRVSRSDGRRPLDDARPEPQVFRTTKVGTLTLAGVAYKIGGRYGDQDVIVHEADDGQIVIADLDGNILIKYQDGLP